MNLFAPFFILSAHRSKYTCDFNTRNHNELLAKLRRHGFACAVCSGCYGGTFEQSVLVIDETPTSPSTASALLELAREYGQESILAVDTNRAARLVYIDRRRNAEPLGVFTAVDREDVAAGAGWTCRAGRYYVCI